MGVALGTRITGIDERLFKEVPHGRIVDVAYFAKERAQQQDNVEVAQLRVKIATVLCLVTLFDLVQGKPTRGRGGGANFRQTGMGLALIDTPKEGHFLQLPK